MSKTELVCSVIAISLIFVTVLAACGVGQGPDEDTPVAVSTPAGPTGEELVQEHCYNSCHDAEAVTSARKTEQEWETTVQRMRLIGAQLTDAEAQTVVDYLSENYGP